MICIARSRWPSTEMVIIPEMEEIKLQKKENKCTELLDLEGEIYGIGIKIVVVYFDSNKGKNGNEANKEIRVEVEKLIEKNEKEGLIVLGDFNGHIKLLDGRKEDLNGKMLGKWIEKYNMVMLNMDEKCKGVYTFSRGNSKTAVDYVMVNERMYNIFENMEIDEDKELFQDSDHHLVSSFYKVRESGINVFNKEKWKTVKFLKKDKDSLVKLREELEEEWGKGGIIDKEMEDESLVEKANEVLGKTIKRKIGKNRKIESIWMNDEIRKGMKKRREINRKHRNCKNLIEKNRLWKSYINQKNIVQKLIRDSREKYEMEMTKEIKAKMKMGKGGKNLWECINKLLGKEMKDEGLEVYDENGRKLEEAEAVDEIEGVFKEIYKSGERGLTPMSSGKWGINSKRELEEKYKREKPDKIDLGGWWFIWGIYQWKNQ